MTAGDPDSPLLGRIVRPADYVRVLATPMRLRSPHFAVHHLEGRPLPPKKPVARAHAGASGDGAAVEAIASVEISVETGHAPVTASLSTELSTGSASSVRLDVDDSAVSVGGYPEASAAPSGPQRWLGLVVPKKNAKRAVTRTLVKRQIRNVALACAPRLAPGLWVVRQRSPFDPKQYPSAASDALKQAARDELRALFERAARGERDKLKPRTVAPKATAKAMSTKTAPPAAAPEGPSCAA